MRQIDTIIIHCSATEDGHPFHASDIDRWHRERGFNMIGYHYVVCLDGTVEDGRPIALQGAHCLGHNQNSIGVCYVGGLVNGRAHDTRTPQQKKALRTLLKRLKEKFPDASIAGHNQFASTACPCFDAASEYGHSFS